MVDITKMNKWLTTPQQENYISYWLFQKKLFVFNINNATVVFTSIYREKILKKFYELYTINVIFLYPITNFLSVVYFQNQC